LAISDPEGSLARLAKLSWPHKVFLHINNTNPFSTKTDRVSRSSGSGLGSCGGRMGIQVAPSEADSRPLTADELASPLERIGEESYHHQHPFHLRMHEGRFTPGQLQAWALNRYYYQSRIPMKDAIILSRREDPGFRRAWRKRIVDHDGQANAGGLECWVQRAEATGLPRKRVTSFACVEPGWPPPGAFRPESL
jgi:hypothetical protein